MTGDRELSAEVRSWLQEEGHEDAERVLFTVFAQIDTTQQRRATWWSARRLLPMNSTMKFALTAAAIIVVAAVGVGVILPRTVGGPSASPTPIPTPTARPLPPQGALAPGGYRMGSKVAQVPFTFVVPAGWRTDLDSFISKDMGGPAEVAFTAWQITHVFSDGCHPTGHLVQVGPTVSDLARALANQKGRDTVGPTDTTLAGLAAKRVELRVPSNWDPAGCEGEFMRNWADPGPGGDTSGGWRSRAGQTDVIYITEVAGKRLVIATWYLPGASEADITQLEGIVASIRFED
jgi:hypothetical protein